MSKWFSEKAIVDYFAGFDETESITIDEVIESLRDIPYLELNKAYVNLEFMDDEENSFEISFSKKVNPPKNDSISKPGTGTFVPPGYATYTTMGEV